MSATFEIEVFEGTGRRSMQAEWLDVRSPTGEFTVGPGHNPLVSLLSPSSVATYKSVNGGMVDIQVPGGLLAIMEDGVVKLLLWEPEAA